VGQEEIEFIITKEGKVQVRTIGIKGARCLDVAEMLAQIIGREESRELTSEYYESGVQTDSHLNLRQRRQ
jgi:hypothetical protein